MARYLLSVHGPATYGALNSACEVDMTKAFADVDAFNERVRRGSSWTTSPRTPSECRAG